jgi:hypothetical protein
MGDIINQGGRRTRRSSAKVKTTPPVESQDDIIWEGDLIQMLSGLESQRAQLAGQSGIQPAALVERLLAMLRLVTKFTEQKRGGHSKGSAEMALYGRTSDTLAMTERWLEQQRPSTFSAFLGLFGKAANPAETASCRPLVQQMVELLESYFVYFASCFHSPSSASNWTETSEVFLTELKQLVK